MTFEEVLIAESPIREAKLYPRARKAFEQPTTGITVQVPAAERVIKDCAKVAIDYIPVVVFTTYANPFSDLQKKFTVEQIKDFVKRSKESVAARALLSLILYRGRSINILTQTAQITQDPYGEYEGAVEPIQQDHDQIYLLCRLFGAL